jgi:hypothetical protein
MVCFGRAMSISRWTLSQLIAKYGTVELRLKVVGNDDEKGIDLVDPLVVVHERW